MNNQYNDGGEAVSYLEFGSIATSPPAKQVYDFRTMQQAYDWFMHARYSQDLSCYLWMLAALEKGDLAETGRLYRELIHHKDDFSSHLSKWAALQAVQEASPVFYEHGQTLFGCIEGIDCCAGLLKRGGILLPEPELTLRQVGWEGFDISPFFNLMAGQLHGGYRVHTHSDHRTVPAQCSVAFAKGVTLLYALRAPEDFFTLFERAALGVFDISFDLTGQSSVTLGTGKQVCFLSLARFKECYAARPGTIRVRRNACGVRENGTRLFVEGIVARESAKANRFVSTDKVFREGLHAAFPDLAAALLPQSGAGYLEWSELGEFLKEQGL